MRTYTFTALGSATDDGLPTQLVLGAMPRGAVTAMVLTADDHEVRPLAGLQAAGTLSDVERPPASPDPNGDPVAKCEAREQRLELMVPAALAGEAEGGGQRLLRGVAAVVGDEDAVVHGGAP